MNVACFTVAAMDYFFQVDQHHPGGNAFNQALGFRLAGHRTAMIGAVGDDWAGMEIRRRLSEGGVDCGRLRTVAGASATNRIWDDEKGERFGEEGAWKGGVYEGFRLSEDDWAYMEDYPVWTTHATCPNYPETIKRVGSRHKLAVDWLHLLMPKDLDAQAEALTIAYIGGVAEMAADLEILAHRHPKTLFVLTLGAGGSRAWLGRESWSQSALAVDKVRDTTGCGDAFQAACTAAWLTGASVPEALKAGAVAGKRCCQYLGAIGWLDSGDYPLTPLA